MATKLAAVALVLLSMGCSGSDATGGGGSGGASATVGSGTGNATAASGTASGPSGTTTGPGATGATATSSSTGSGGPGLPPFGGSSGGSGGPAPVGGATAQAGNVTYYLVVPASYSATQPTPFLLVFSGTEGGNQMTQNLINVGPSTGTSTFIRAVLDGVQYNGNGAAGATVLDAVRTQYNVDNDRTYLLGESAGTSAAEQLGFTLRESYFAAYWANDVNQAATPAQNANAIGFQPWGQVGPGGGPCF